MLALPEYGGRQSEPLPIGSGLAFGRSRSSPSPPTIFAKLICVCYLCINYKCCTHTICVAFISIICVLTH